MKIKKPSFEKKKALAGFLFTIPWLIGAFNYFLVPLAQSFIFTFNEIIPGNGIQYEFKGLKFYKEALFSDVEFIRVLAANIGDMLVRVVLVILFSLFIANILNQKFRGRLLARAVFFLPVIIASGVVISIIKGDIFAQTALAGQASGSQFQITVLQNILYTAKISQQTISSLLSVLNSLFEVAWYSGIQILIFMAGLQAIPTQVKEAASIEGATSWEFFWKITLPMISPIVQINIIYSIVDSLTDYSNPMIQRIYGLSRDLNFSYGATLSWIYYGVIFLFVGVAFAFMNKKTFYYVD
ncbi:MAG: carbohydrate ABC transporter permease [Saccharofermentanales bacterium]